MFKKILKNNYIKLSLLLLIPVIYKILLFKSAKLLVLLLDNINNYNNASRVCMLFIFIRFMDMLLQICNAKISMNVVESINNLVKEMTMDKFFLSSYISALQDVFFYNSLKLAMRFLRLFVMMFFNTLYPSIISIIVLIFSTSHLYIKALLIVYLLLIITVMFISYVKILLPKLLSVNNKEVDLAKFYEELNNNLLTSKIFNINAFIKNLYDHKIQNQNIANRSHFMTFTIIANFMTFFSSVVIVFCMWILIKSNVPIVEKKQIIIFMIPLIQEFCLLIINIVWNLDFIGALKFSLSYILNKTEKIDMLILDALKIHKIEVKNIKFKYKDKYIFDDFSYVFNTGNTYHLKAVSGKGKSTLLKILMGLLPVEEGQVIINDVIINNQMATKYFSYATQNQLIFDLSVQENILLDKPVDSLFHDIVNKLNLTNILHQNVGRNGDKISGGELKRLVIARMLFHYKPDDVVIFDEPFEGLNKELVQEIIAFIQSFKANMVIIIDHTNNISSINNIISVDL